MGWSLDRDALIEIDQIVRATINDPVGPEFMAPPPRNQSFAETQRSSSARDASPEA
jgi:hypothetical protein